MQIIIFEAIKSGSSEKSILLHGGLIEGSLLIEGEGVITFDKLDKMLNFVLIAICLKMSWSILNYHNSQTDSSVYKARLLLRQVTNFKSMGIFLSKSRKYAAERNLCQVYFMFLSVYQILN